MILTLRKEEGEDLEVLEDRVEDRIEDLDKKLTQIIAMLTSIENALRILQCLHFDDDRR